MKTNIGVVGYSSQKFDKSVAKALIIKAFDQVVSKFPDGEYVVVSGLTDLGIPGLAYREADSRGWGTVGVACKRAKEYACYDVDEVKIIGEEWGDESETFLKSIDCMVKIGGGKQSIAEAKQARDKGKIVIEFELESGGT